MRIFASAFDFAFACTHGVIRQTHTFLKAVHMELPDKWRIVVMLKQFRNQGFGKFVFIQHEKESPSFDHRIRFSFLLCARKLGLSEHQANSLETMPAYLLSFCTNGGICCRSHCASRSTICAISSRKGKLSCSLRSFRAWWERNIPWSSGPVHCTTAGLRVTVEFVCISGSVDSRSGKDFDGGTTLSGWDGGACVRSNIFSTGAEPSTRPLRSSVPFHCMVPPPPIPRTYVCYVNYWVCIWLWGWKTQRQPQTAFVTTSMSMAVSGF
jgi:hypothetical protein